MMGVRVTLWEWRGGKGLRGERKLENTQINKVRIFMITTLMKCNVMELYAKEGQE